MQRRERNLSLLIEEYISYIPPVFVPGFLREGISRITAHLFRLFRDENEGIEDRVRGLLFSPLFKAKELRIGRNIYFEGRNRIQLGDGVRLHGQLCISAAGPYGQLQVGNHTHIDHFSVLYAQGGIKIGEGCAIASGVIIYSQTNQYDAQPGVTIIQQGTRYAKVEIGDDVWIGAGAIILPGVSIGDHAVIGAGSVVTRNIETATIVVGSPARPIKKREGFL